MKKKNPKYQRFGPDNGRWKGGKSKTYYRRVMGCEKNDGTIVHHLPKKGLLSRLKAKRIPHTKDRAVVLKPSKNLSARGKHNKLHPEKGGVH